MTSHLSTFLKGAGVGAVAAVLMGTAAHATRGDRYSFPIFLTTLTGLTIVGGISATIAVNTEDKNYDQGYQAALEEIERQVHQQQSSELARPSMVGKNGQISPAS